MTDYGDLMLNLSPTDRVRAKLERVPDSSVVTLSKDDARALLEWWQEAGLAAYWAWERLRKARTLPEQADAITDLSNAMSDLSSYLPGYDSDRGEIVSDEPEHFES